MPNGIGVSQGGGSGWFSRYCDSGGAIHPANVTAFYESSSTADLQYGEGPTTVLAVPFAAQPAAHRYAWIHEEDTEAAWWDEHI